MVVFQKKIVEEVKFPKNLINLFSFCLPFQAERVKKFWSYFINIVRTLKTSKELTFLALSTED